ncbi:hypothetical protein [Massilia sp. BJB1822]|uniref:hypothetical protein n=1 Tax=Massilia sp. BJB1822 TaxID=2744470 RepID=UPI00159375D2|nr:hypothetical protein [Massilia sp. BJB1822]NVE01253.1 hypothetical protein [Massilia sp. BJB1822]
MAIEQDVKEATADVQQLFGLGPPTEQANAIFASLLERLKTAATSSDPSQFDTMLEIMDRMAAEIQDALPDLPLLMELNNELLRIQAARMNKAAADIAQAGNTVEFGFDPAAQTAEFEARANRINTLAAKKVAQINALTALVVAITRNSGGAPPPTPPIDNDGRGGDDGRMNERITALEKFAEKSGERLAKIEQDVAVIRANFAPKDDLTKVVQDVAVIRSNYSTKADLHTELHTMTWKIITAAALLVAAVFFIARNVSPPAPPVVRQPAAAFAAPASPAAAPEQAPAPK